MTDDTTGNQIVSYFPGPNGALHQVGRYGTGGLGVAISVAVVDDLAGDPVVTEAGTSALSTYAVNPEGLSPSGARSTTVLPPCAGWPTTATGTSTEPMPAAAR